MNDFGVTHAIGYRSASAGMEGNIFVHESAGTGMPGLYQCSLKTHSRSYLQHLQLRRIRDEGELLGLTTEPISLGTVTQLRCLPQPEADPRTSLRTSPGSPRARKAEIRRRDRCSAPTVAQRCSRLRLSKQDGARPKR